MENTTQGRKLTIEQILMPLFLNAGYNCDEPNERRLFIAAADAMKKYTAQEKQEQRDPDGWVFRKNFYNNHKDAVIAAGGAGGDHLDLHPVWFSPPPVTVVGGFKVTPLSEITDEDVKIVAKMYGVEIIDGLPLEYASTGRMNFDNVKKSIILKRSLDAYNAKVYLFLQSRGYEVPVYYPEK